MINARAVHPMSGHTLIFDCAESSVNRFMHSAFGAAPRHRSGSTTEILIVAEVREMQTSPNTNRHVSHLALWAKSALTLSN